ncbi:MAG: hypothetical protein V1720_05970 [bacterium]
MLITIGAIMLLSLVIVRVNSGFLNTSTVLMDSKFGVMAVSLGTSVLEEAVGKAFDENTIVNSVASLTSLSSALGKNTGESYTSPTTPFDDFDDYNGLTTDTRADTTLKSAVFYISSVVGYVNASNADVFTTNRTWHKKIIVTVTSPSMVDTVRLSQVYSYFYFR